MKIFTFGKNRSKDRCLEDLHTYCGRVDEAFVGVFKIVIPQLINTEDVWNVNFGDQGRLWLLQDGGVYVAWKYASDDICRLLPEGHLFNAINHKLSAARLRAAGLIVPDGTSSMFLIQPETWTSLKYRKPPCNHTNAIRIKDPAWLGVKDWPEPVKATFIPSRY